MQYNTQSQVPNHKIDFTCSPDAYRHWKLKFADEVAELVMDVDENAGLFPGYRLKLNSYDPRNGSRSEAGRLRIMPFQGHDTRSSTAEPSPCG